MAEATPRHDPRSSGGLSLRLTSAAKASATGGSDRSGKLLRHPKADKIVRS